ncbi:MAG: mechanosensitive ion channel family protein [Trichlorobacter sp.]|jgi:small-conductance mechanosensitive channel
MDNLLTLLIALFVPSASDGTSTLWAKHLLLATLVIASFWLLSQAVAYLFRHWVGRLTSFTRTDLDDRILKRIAPSVSLLITFTGIYLGFRSLPLHEKLFKLIAGGLYVANVVIVCVLVYRVLNETLAWYVEHCQDQQDSLLSRQMTPLAEKVAMIFIIGGALMVVLKHFHYDILSLVTALGIGSLAIGMAAKDSLAHLISGFTLMLDRPFRLGDRIQLIGGQVGDVQDIGLRSTKIKTLDNQLLVIPNSDLCNTMVLNQAFPDQRVKGRINLGVAYGSDIDQVKTLLVATAQEVAEVLADPAPEAFFTAFGDSSLSLALFFWVDEYGKLFATTDQINTLILRRFREQGIEIPYPIRTILMQPQEAPQPSQRT